MLIECVGASWAVDTLPVGPVAMGLVLELVMDRSMRLGRDRTDEESVLLGSKRMTSDMMEALHVVSSDWRDQHEIDSLGIIHRN